MIIPEMRLAKLVVRDGFNSVETDFEGYSLENASQDTFSARRALLILTILNIVFSVLTVAHILYGSWQSWRWRQEKAPMPRR